MKKKFLIALGERVCQIRLEKKMSMAELGRKTGKDYHSIARLEKGNINPSLIYLIEISKGLGVKISALVSELP